MKTKILSVILVVAMICSIGVTIFASYDPTTNYVYGYDGSNYYGYNYNNGSYGTYYMSSWAEDLEIAYEPTWYESPQRQVTRGEAFLLYLRAVQRSLDRQGYSRLMSGYGSVPFSDYLTVNPYAQGEVNVLYANGILVGYDDNTMRFSQKLKRSEMAAIYSRFNRIYFNMGTGYNQWNYDGYNNYYNNNYNNYYNNYMFVDINGHWAAQDIITAASNGVLRGVGNNYFDTEGPLTIEQIWKMLDCCVGYQGLKRSDIAYAMSQTFKVKFGKNIDESYGLATGTKITRISSTTASLTISEGESRNIKVNIYPTTADYQKLNWTSANINYVSIEESWNSSSGIAYVTVYGRRPSNGYVKITGRAMDGSGETVTFSVRVDEDEYYDDYYDDEEISSITPSESTIYLETGESVQIKAKVLPTDAYNKNLKWTSMDSSIAYVSNIYTSGSNSYATITGRSSGTTYVYITAQDGSGEQESVKVIVDNGNTGSSIITSATATPSSVNMTIGQNESIKIVAYPTTAADKNITWITDNSNIATVQKISNTSIRIFATGIGRTNIRGINSSGDEICIIPVNVKESAVTPPDDGADDTDRVAPVVTLEGATNVNIGDTITITAKAYDETKLTSFNIGVNSITGMTGSLSPTKIEKISNSEYRITMMGVEVASQCICIKSGAAIDAAGNLSEESNEIVIFVNSGEE